MGGLDQPGILGEHAAIVGDLADRLPLRPEVGPRIGHNNGFQAPISSQSAYAPGRA